MKPIKWALVIGLVATLTACASQQEPMDEPMVIGDSGQIQDPDGGIGGTGIVAFR